MASAVLIVGLTGLTQLVVYGMNGFRSSVVQTGAELESQAAVADVLMTPYGSLTDGTFDGGMTIDVDGRKYTRLIIVTPAGDGGGIGAHRVEVRTAWTDGVGRQRQAIAVGLISERPDANY
jgi:hypothetical protein